MVRAHALEVEDCLHVQPQVMHVPEMKGVPGHCPWLFLWLQLGGHHLVPILRAGLGGSRKAKCV